MIQVEAVWNRNARFLAAFAAFASVISFLLIDHHTQRLTAQFDFPGDVREALDFFANLGHGVFCVFVVVTVFCLDPANRRSVALIAIGPFLSGMVTSLVKWLVWRPRPAIVAGLQANLSDSPFNQAAIQSFPSGHTATAFALATGLSMIYPHGKTYFFSLAVLVAIQRVLVQAHYPSDVLAGAVIGFLVTALTGLVFCQRNKSATLL